MTIRHDPNFVSTAFIYVHATFIHSFIHASHPHSRIAFIQCAMFIHALHSPICCIAFIHLFPCMCYTHSCISFIHAFTRYIRLYAALHPFFSSHVSATSPHTPLASILLYHVSHTRPHTVIPPCLYHLLTIYQVKCLAPSQGDTSRMGSRHQASSHRFLLFSLVHIAWMHIFISLYFSHFLSHLFSHRAY